MKLLIGIPVITLFLGFLLMNVQFDSGDLVNYKEIDTQSRLQNDTTEFDQEKALEMLREEIEGMEDQPAAEVFQNIKMMKQVPAGRLLRIMEFGFTQSLGVNCTHCHNPKNFADEDKPQKQIAREMMKMAERINNELLTKIENLDSDKPTVNCTTCHRGEVKPALNLDNQ